MAITRTMLKSASTQEEPLFGASGKDTTLKNALTGFYVPLFPKGPFPKFASAVLVRIKSTFKNARADRDDLVPQEEKKSSRRNGFLHTKPFGIGIELIGLWPGFTDTKGFGINQKPHYADEGSILL